MRVLSFLTILIAAFGIAMPVQAQGGLSIIRDTEIEQTLKKWSEPIFQQANLGTDQINMALVNSPEVNAFVAGGANIFIYAGLILAADYPEEVIGVIAHELGHIEGGHLIAGRRAMERASYQSMLAMVVGIGAAAATGDGGAAAVIGGGGSNAALRGFLSHSRTHESSADQAALRYMEGASVNPKGLVTFLEKLEGQELLPASQQSEYMRTHPLTRNRIESMRQGAKKSPHYSEITNSPQHEQFNLIKAKLRGFLEPHMVPRYYDIDQEPADDIDLYAYAIMYYQQKDFSAALDLFDKLIANDNQNPYFVEMKAQILRDSGDLEQSEKFYKQAMAMIEIPAPLMQVALAHVMIEQQDTSEAVEQLLLSALQQDGHHSRTYRLLATLKGRQGFEADAQYYLAEEAASLQKFAEAKHLLELSLKNNNLSDDLIVKAQDLKLYLNTASGL